MTEILAVDGGRPVRSTPYPDWPQWDQDEEQALLETLHSGNWWAPPGEQVHAFQKGFARYHDAEYGVACTNGSAALEVCLRAAQIDWGDEVITSPYTFIATANSCLLIGAIPVFVDLQSHSWNIDPDQIEAAITPRTRAIMPVYIAGEPADMDAIMDIARRHDLLVIEDACQAHGATWKGQKVGSIGDMGCFSFQASKNVTGGEGGIVITNDEGWAEKCWSVTNVGRKRHGEFYQHIGLASNYRLSEWAAAVLRVQLTRLEAQAANREENAAYLAKALQAVDGLDPVPNDPRVTRNAYHLFRIWYNPAQFGDHDAAEFVEAMQAEGIPIGTGYPIPLARHPVVTERTAFIRDRLGLDPRPVPALPVCEEVCRRGLWMPQYTLLGQHRDMDDVVTAARKIQGIWTA